MNVLVTGGSGTIGGYVLRSLLEAGHVVTCFSRTEPRVTGVRFIMGDVTELDQIDRACHGHDTIIHLAAVPGPGRATLAQMLHVNVTGTGLVLEAALRAGVGKVVFASSGAVSGFSFQNKDILPQYLPLDEQHQCEPHDEYGLSKLLAEITCRRYTDAFGLRTICLRINHNWYVDREGAEVAVLSGWAQNLSVDELWTQRYQKCLQDAEGNWPVPGPPRPRNLLWAVTDARDAAQAFCLAVENDSIQHNVFQISGPETCSLVETETLLARYFPDIPLKSVLKGFDSLVSHAKATKLLGYRPQYSWRESDFAVWLANRSPV